MPEGGRATLWSRRAPRYHIVGPARRRSRCCGGWGMTITTLRRPPNSAPTATPRTIPASTGAEALGHREGDRAEEVEGVGCLPAGDPLRNRSGAFPIGRRALAGRRAKGVGIDRPLQPGHTGMQVPLNRRQRHVDDRRVQAGREQAHAADRQDEPAAPAAGSFWAHHVTDDPDDLRTIWSSGSGHVAGPAGWCTLCATAQSARGTGRVTAGRQASRRGRQRAAWTACRRAAVMRSSPSVQRRPCTGPRPGPGLASRPFSTRMATHSPAPTSAAITTTMAIATPRGHRHP
jgi:hypothetical protein